MQVSFILKEVWVGGGAVEKFRMVKVLVYKQWSPTPAQCESSGATVPLLLACNRLEVLSHLTFPR